MDALVCPITQERIRDPVRTLAGIIYERGAIAAWLAVNGTDPVTRLVLPSKHLVNVTAADVHQSPSEFRVGLVWTVHTPIYHMALEAETKFEPGGLNAVGYSLARMRHLQENGEMLWFNPPSSESVDQALGLVRAPGTGSHFQCLDVCNAVIRRARFKCVDFRGSRFRGTVFVGCEFSRCNFSRTDLARTAFGQCVFRGEQTIFVGAKTSRKTIVDQCRVESYRSWTMTDEAEAREQLRARGLAL